MVRKLTCIFLTFILIFQICALPVFAEVNEDSEYWNTMKSFGVVEQETNRESTFTIADMSKMLYNFLNTGKDYTPEATHQIYTDVDRWHWAAGYIEWLYNNRIYTGDGSGIFEPERNAKLSDVCSVTLNLLGYIDLMNKINDDTDVIKKASQIGLLSSKVKKVEHEVTYDEFASVCYELLFTDIIEPVYSAKNAYKSGEEFISEVLDLKYDKGIVTGANGYSLDGNYCDIDAIVIDGYKFDTLLGVDYTRYIGYNVKYYYSEEEFVIAAVPLKNKELIIKSDDILSYINNTYTYKESSRKKTAKTDRVLLLYNGKTTTTRSAFTPSYGQVRLIDNDNDGKFECVISEDAVNIVVEKIVDGIIYGKNADVSGKKYAIDTKELDIKRFVGNTVPAEELKEDTIITAVISEDGKYGCFYVSTEKSTGVLDRIESDIIIVDGVEHAKADNMYNPDTITSSGSDIEFYVDIYGNIASIVVTNENKYTLGYLISVKEDTKEDKLMLKILTSGGGILKLYTADRLFIDGNKMATLNAAKLSLTENEVIRYRISEGEIRHIDTATQISGFSDFRISSDRDSLTMIAKGENMIYKSVPQVFKYYGTAMDVHAEFAVNDETTVFFVPTEAESTNEKDYYVGDKSSLQDDLLAGVQAYVTDSDTLFAKAVVVRYDTQVLLSTKFTIVDKITVTLNSDDEVVGQISGFSNGSEINAIVPDQSLLTNIGRGSIIRYRTNRDGEVKAISNIYGLDGTGTVNTSATHSWTSGSTGINANVRVVVGTVYEREGTVVRFKFKDDASGDELFNLKNCNIYVYDESSEERIRTGSVDDLFDYEHYRLNCDEVIICTRAANVSDVFIMKK